MGLVDVIVEGGKRKNINMVLYEQIKDVEILEHVQLLNCDNNKFILYGEASNYLFKDFEILNYPTYSEFEEIEEKLKGGLVLPDLEPSTGWDFDFKRSIILSDGRVFVKAAFFQKDYRPYLNAIPKILKNCREIFGEGMTTRELNKEPKRIE